MKTLFVALGFLILGSAVNADPIPATPTSVSGDFDGDGASDRAELIQQQTSVTLSVHVGSFAPQIFKFRVDPGSQNAICSLPATLSTSVLFCRPDGADGEQPLPGCTEVPGKVGLDISDGNCDAVHLYWNQDANQMVWWRR
jgi:hypothetical protein